MQTRMLGADSTKLRDAFPLSFCDIRRFGFGHKPAGQHSQGERASRRL